MKITSLTQSDWTKMLKDAAGKPDGSHKYLAISGDEVYTFDTIADMERSFYHKMTLSKMTEISRDILNKGDSDPKLSSKMSKYLERITDSKSAKLNSCSNKIGRAFLSVVKYASYASLVGIPLALKIRSFQNNLEIHQTQIKEARRFAKVDPHPSQKRFLNKVQEIINDEKNPEMIRTIIEGQIADDAKNFEGDTEIVTQFHKDHTRPLVSLAELHDNRQNLWTFSKGLKSGEDPIKNRDAQFKKIKQVVSYRPGDERWLGVIQATVTQSIGNAALTHLLVSSKMAAVEDETLKNNDRLIYSIKENKIPIAIEVVRHPTTRNIEKIMVSTNIHSDIYHFETNAKNSDQKTRANVIGSVTTGLSFEVKLDKQGNPKVENLVHQHLLSKKPKSSKSFKAKPVIPAPQGLAQTAASA